MRRFILTILIFISAVSCTNSYRPSDKVQIANQVRRKAAFKLEQDKGLIPIGTGGRMMDQITQLHLAFQYRQPLDIKEGRELLLAAVQVLLDEINSDEDIRPYLNEYPFQANDISIAIYPQKPDGSTFGPGKLSVVSVDEGIAKYKGHDAEGSPLQTFYKETYNEALEKVHALAKAS